METQHNILLRVASKNGFVWAHQVALLLSLPMVLNGGELILYGYCQCEVRLPLRQGMRTLSK